MKIAYKHLIKHIDSKPCIEEVSDKLFQLGHEHEVQNNIFDIDFTPNRGDCLSLNGLLRDLKVFYDIKISEQTYQNEIEPLDLNFTNNAIDDCINISFLKIEIDGIIKPYQDKLKEYFELYDVNQKNFFTDISNYVSYETGQPTHCYDSDKVGKAISLEKIKSTVRFSTLLDKEITLEGENIVFTSNDKVINLAGVVGGKESACSSDTNSVIVECAHFNSEAIIGKSLQYGIQSDAAYKFERSVDPYCHDYVLKRFIQIVKDHANIKSLKIFSKSYKERYDNAVSYDLNNINKIIGTDINQEKFASFLTNLNFRVSDSQVIVPSFRHDINTENDIAEEIARCIGYNNINPMPLEINNANSKSSEEITTKENKIKSLLIDNGFYEVINFPFSEKSKNCIKVDNPIDSGKPYFRENIIDSLAQNLLFNERRQHDSIKLFEISDIYTMNDNGFHEKQKKIGIIGSGRIGKSYDNFSKKIDSSYLTKILDEYHTNIPELIKELPRAHLDTKIKSKIFYAELNILDFNNLTEENIYVLDSPILSNSQFLKFKEYFDKSFTIIDCTFEKTSTLKKALDK